MNKLAIVVLNWNGADIIENSIVSLAQQTHKNFKIIVVDNGSNDGSIAILKRLDVELKEKIHVIYNKKNSGFAGGVNIGINYALNNNFFGIALFNNDATADKEWLRHLSLTLEGKPDVGIVTGLLLHEDGRTIDSSGDWYTTWGLPYPRGRDLDSTSAAKAGLVFGASGGASLYRSEMLKNVGLFDENFFAYYEDVDMSFRAQLGGWKVYYEPKAIGYHEQGGTSKKIPGFTVYQTFKNLPLLFLKNVPTGMLLVIGIRFFIAYWLMFFKTTTKGTFLSALKGYLASIYYTPVSLIRRFHIQKNKVVTNDYIRSILWNDLPPVQTGLRKMRSYFMGSIK